MDILAVFFFNDTATTEIYTLSLHDALPICPLIPGLAPPCVRSPVMRPAHSLAAPSVTPSLSDSFVDRKSTRLNSSHANISYAVFCLKKKYVHIYSTLSPSSLSPSLSSHFHS